jgi:hypothetical protein
MRKQLCFGLTALALATLAVPARAQNFLTGSFEAIRPGYLRMIGAPTHMFGRDGRPDRTGGAFRAGYGLSDTFGVEGKAAFFDGVTLVGGDGHFRLLDGDTTLSVGVGGHQALMSSAPDSTALDLAAELHTHFTSRLDLYAGTSFSYEFMDNAVGSDFTRVYVVPGIRYALADRVDLLVEGGVGLNRNSPHYVAAGFAWHVPVSASARGRDRH